jgi:hypothetical protein
MNTGPRCFPAPRARFAFRTASRPAVHAGTGTGLPSLGLLIRPFPHTFRYRTLPRTPPVPSARSLIPLPDPAPSAVPI